MVARLFGYGGQLHALRSREIGPFSNLLLCMVVTAINGALRSDLQGLRAEPTELAPGYYLVETKPYRLLVVHRHHPVAGEPAARAAPRRVRRADSPQPARAEEARAERAEQLGRA